MLLFVLILPFGVSQTVNAETTASSIQEKTLSFMQDCLLINLNEYNVTLLQDDVTPPSKPDYPMEALVSYAVESKDARLTVSCIFQNDVLTGGTLKVTFGSASAGLLHADLKAAADSFLTNYGDYTGDNPIELVTALSSVDVLVNKTVVVGNTKLDVTLYSTETNFRWSYTANGVDYTSLSVTFRNGVFYSFRDDRYLYKIGDTTVKVTEEQATKTALNYIKTYSYTALNGSTDNPVNVKVAGFDVNESLTTAKLNTDLRGSDTLYPYWSIQLTLNQFYPGNVWAFQVRIWADTGEVFKCLPLAVGGSIDDASNSNPPENSALTQPSQQTPSDSSTPQTSTSATSTSNEEQSHNSNLATAAIAATATILGIIIAATLTIKKTRK